MDAMKVASQDSLGGRISTLGLFLAAVIILVVRIHPVAVWYSNQGYVALAVCLVRSAFSFDRIILDPLEEPVDCGAPLERANQYFEMSLDSQPGYLPAHRGLATVNLASRGFDDTEGAFSSADVGEGLLERHILGLMLYRRHRLEEAALIWRTTPGVDSWLLGLGKSLLATGGACPQAKRVLDLAIRVMPTRAEARYQLGKASECLSDSVAAEKAYTIAAGLFPRETLQHYLALGRAAYLGQDWDVALRAYARAVLMVSDDQPEEADAYWGLAETWQASGRDPPRAIEVWQRAAEVTPDSPWPYLHMGDIAVGNGQLTQALELYLHAESMAPHESELKARLGQVYLEMGRLDAAVEASNTAIALSGDVAWYYLVLGDAEAARGNLSEAEDAYARALTLDPGLAEAERRLTSLRRKK